MSLPIRRNNFDVQGFTAYLARHGCEVGKPSNPYEVVRYRAYHAGSKRPVWHIVYAKDTGLLTWCGGSQGHYRGFVEGRSLMGINPPFVAAVEGQRAKPQDQRLPRPGTKPRGNAPTRAALLRRDGPDCWFCGTVMGEDCTIEHLVPKSKGGANSKANYVLAHAACNCRAANMPLVDKIAMRENLRKELA